MVIESIRTMTEEEIGNLTADAQNRLHELYVEHCKQSKIHGSLRDFIIWLKER